MMIKQGKWPVEEYIASFKIIISWSKIMEDVVLIWDFQKGLNPKLVKKIWAQMVENPYPYLGLKSSPVFHPLIKWKFIPLG